MNNKPMSIRRMELINQIADLINTSELPPYIVEAILKDFLQTVTAAVQKQYMADLQSLQEGEKTDGDNQDDSGKSARSNNRSRQRK